MPSSNLPDPIEVGNDTELSEPTMRMRRARGVMYSGVVGMFVWLLLLLGPLSTVLLVVSAQLL